MSPAFDTESFIKALSCLVCILTCLGCTPTYYYSQSLLGGTLRWPFVVDEEEDEINVPIARTYLTRVYKLSINTSKNSSSLLHAKTANNNVLKNGWLSRYDVVRHRATRQDHKLTQSFFARKLPVLQRCKSEFIFYMETEVICVWSSSLRRRSDFESQSRLNVDGRQSSRTPQI